MIRRWLLPIAIGLIFAGITYWVTLRQTPKTLMSAAVSRLSKAGVNQFTHAPLANDTSRAIVRPSPDLAYSSCPFDLTAGPLAITVMPLPTQYWSLSVFDSDTDAAFVRNNGETRGQPLRLVVALPGQTVPAGIETVQVKSAKGIALIRALVQDRADFAGIDRARRVASCATVRG